MRLWRGVGQVHEHVSSSPSPPRFCDWRVSTRRAAGRAFRQLDAEAAAPGEDRDVARSRARLRAIWPFQLLARAPVTTVAAQATFARARGAVHALSTARRRAIASRAIPSDPCRPPQPPHVLQSTVVGFDGMCSPVNWTPGPPHSARRASCRVGLVLGLHLSYDSRWALGLSLVSTWHSSTLPGCPTAACLFMPPSSRPRRARHQIERTAEGGCCNCNFQPSQRP
ncbi:hypothetical protein PVAP13_9NG670328 [Panicum virgatum]|uniref:Uncharacterized protein n=1 Tax=Panicum virgatum TaxID=38727 RepID=A0A8T0MWZ1_PANVG|nr:hypothetical protein PVAP13_9NG670328 [Panicum virgatum]